MNSLSSFRKTDTHKTMGIEIECLIDIYSPTYVYPSTYIGFFYASTDESISPGRLAADFVGTEFVSQPLSPKWLIKEINRLNKKIAGWEYNSTCGIHIHVSRKWLSSKRAKLIHKFYCQLEDSDRGLLFGRGSNNYCTTDEWDSNRYCAINNQNSFTIEFRMFSSGNARWAAYCVQMVEYLIHNAKHLNFEAASAFRDSILES